MSDPLTRARDATWEVRQALNDLEGMSLEIASLRLQIKRLREDRAVAISQPCASCQDRARAEAVEWDEFGQAYNANGELVICICGQPFPRRGTHYCPYDAP